MRFARQSTIFRGPLDPVPVVGVLFLLVIFMLLGSQLYTPGVLVKFEGDAAPNAPIITVTSSGEILFAGKTNKTADLTQLRADVRAEDLKSKLGKPPIQLQVQPGADPKLVEQVRELFQVQLSDGDRLTGTDNPTVIVEVNFRGQYFFESRSVQEAELKAELRGRLQEARSASKKLTLVLRADKTAENEVVMHLFHLAQEVGITEFLLAERSRDLSMPRTPLQP